MDGGAGADILNDNGQSGISLIGGAGNDTFIVSNPGTIITETANNGTDTVQTTLSSYQLPANVERLVYTGVGSFTATANAAEQRSPAVRAQIQLGDGGFANVTLRGSGGADTFIVTNASTTVTEVAGATELDGNDDALQLLLGIQYPEPDVHRNTQPSPAMATVWRTPSPAAPAIDTLFGNGGNDTLIGGAGNDRLSGSSGPTPSYSRRSMPRRQWHLQCRLRQRCDHRFHGQHDQRQS